MIQGKKLVQNYRKKVNQIWPESIYLTSMNFKNGQITLDNIITILDKEVGPDFRVVRDKLRYFNEENDRYEPIPEILPLFLLKNNQMSILINHMEKIQSHDETLIHDFLEMLVAEDSESSFQNFQDLMYKFKKNHAHAPSNAYEKKCSPATYKLQGSNNKKYSKNNPGQNKKELTEILENFEAKMNQKIEMIKNLVIDLDTKVWVNQTFIGVIQAKSDFDDIDMNLQVSEYLTKCFDEKQKEIIEKVRNRCINSYQRQRTNTENLIDLKNEIELSKNFSRAQSWISNHTDSGEVCVVNPKHFSDSQSTDGFVIGNQSDGNLTFYDKSNNYFNKANSRYEYLENSNENQGSSLNSKLSTILSKDKVSVSVDLANQNINLSKIWSRQSHQKATPDKNTFFKNLLNDTIHFALIYSNPQVVLQEKSGRKAMPSLPQHDPVDFAKEIDNISKNFNYSKKKLNVHIECSNIDNFITLVKRKPLIQHIMCHGNWDKANDNFYLEFETKRTDMFKLTNQELKDRIGADEDLSDIKIVFLNACYSERIAQVFIELKVRCVVVVKSKFKINEVYAQNISEKFYSNLLGGSTVQVAWNQAVLSMKNNCPEAINTCCCCHDHAEDCKWSKYLEENGPELAHDRHVPKCNCPRKFEHYHTYSCDWAYEFAQDFYPDDSDIFDEDDQDDDYDTISEINERKVCCCKLDLDHAESLKYVIKYNNDEDKNLIVFDNLQQGVVKNVNSNIFIKNYFYEQKPIGKNKTIYNMFVSLVDERKSLINLYGSKFSGKTQVAKSQANKLLETNHIKKVSHILIEPYVSVAALETQINSQLRLQGVDDCGKTNNTAAGTLLLQDNLSINLTESEESLNELQGFFKGLVEKTRIKICVTTLKQVNLFDEWSLSLQANEPISFLDVISAAKILRHLTNNDQNQAGQFNEIQKMDIWDLANDEVFKQRRDITPNYIMQIVKLLKANKTMTTVRKIMRDYVEGNDDISETNNFDFYKKFVDMLKNVYDVNDHSKDLYNSLLEFICQIVQFPEGILKRDITYMVRKSYIRQKNYFACIYIGCKIENCTIEEIDKLNDEYIEKYLKDKHFSNDEIFNSILEDCINDTKHLLVLERHNIGDDNFEEKLKPSENFKRFATQNRKIFASNSINEIFYLCMIFNLLFLKEVMSSLVHKIKVERMEFEVMIENSCLCSCPFWNIDKDDYYIYLSSDTSIISLCKKLYEQHKTNATQLVQNHATIELSELVEKIVTFDDVSKNNIALVIENLCCCLLTVSKIYKEQKIPEIVDRLKVIIGSVHTSGLFSHSFEIKLELFLATWYKKEIKSNKTYHDPGLEQKLANTLNVLDKLTKRYTTKDELFTFSTYYSMICLSSHNLRKRQHFRKTLDEKDDNIAYKNLESTLKYLKAKGHLPNQYNSSYLLLYSKAVYCMAKFKAKRDQITNDSEIFFENMEVKPIKVVNHSKYDLDRLKDILNNFEELDQPFLYAKSARLLGRMTECLHKRLQYFKSALKKVEEIGDMKDLNLLKDDIKKVNDKMNNENKRIFVFLRVNTVNIKFLNSKGVPAHIRTGLRNSQYEKLSNTKKEVYTRFEIFNKKSYKEYFIKKKGCRMLVLDIYGDLPKGKFIYENSGSMTIQEISYEKLQEDVFRENSEDDLCDVEKKLNFDILFIMNPQSKEIAEFISNHLKVRYVIYFDMEEPTNNIDLLTKWFHVNYMTKIVNSFCEELTKNNMTPENAQNNASGPVVDLLYHEFTNYYAIANIIDVANHKKLTNLLTKEEIKKVITDIIHGGVKILINDPTDIEPNIEINPFVKGTLKDMSSITDNPYRSSVSRFNMQVRRDDNLLQIISKLEKNQFQNVFGDAGIGKTHLLDLLAFELIERDIFTDGVVLFKLKDLVEKWRCSEENQECSIGLKDLLKPRFDSSFDQNMQDFFSKKEKMLIILDDFKLVTEEKKIVWPKSFFTAIKSANNVKMILITEKAIEKTERIEFINENFNHLDSFKVPRMNMEQSIIVMLESLLNSENNYKVLFNEKIDMGQPEKLFFRFSNPNTYKFQYDCEAQKSSEGNPAQLSKINTINRFIVYDLKLKNVQKVYKSTEVEIRKSSNSWFTTKNQLTSKDFFPMKEEQPESQDSDYEEYCCSNSSRCSSPENHIPLNKKLSQSNSQLFVDNKELSNRNSRFSEKSDRNRTSSSREKKANKIERQRAKHKLKQRNKASLIRKVIKKK